MKRSLFGTDGIRASVGTAPCTQPDLIALGTALAQWAQKKYKKAQPAVLIAHDTRISCSWIKACLSTGLLSNSVNIFDAHVLPTPAALVLMQEYALLTNIDCAVIISASHNPFHDNGIKIFDQKGKLSLTDEQEITRLFYEERAEPAHFDARALGHAALFENAESLYCAKIAHYFKPDFLKGLTIVLDCAQGATYHAAPRIFRKLGAQVIVINHHPTGYNINEQCGSTHPTTVREAVLAHKADLGCAFDGDGDRLLLINRHGEVKDGDDCLALLAQHPAYQNVQTIVGTLMTNYGLEQHLKCHHKTLARTPVGDKHVIERMKNDQSLLGGEPSGHLICGDILMAGDGTIAALRCIESMLFNKNDDLISFQRMPSRLINIPITDRLDITQEPFSAILGACEQLIQPGRLVLRYSGTEPLLRILIETHSENVLNQAKDMIMQKIVPLFSLNK